MISLNVMIESLETSQLSFYLTMELNKNKHKINGVVFVENIVPIKLKPEFPVMTVAELWEDQNITITTYSQGASKLLRFPGPTRKIFYLWDLYFLRGHGVRNFYESYANLFAEPSLEIVVKSESHKQIVENNFNIKVKVVQDCNIDEFIDVLGLDAPTLAQPTQFALVTGKTV